MVDLRKIDGKIYQLIEIVDDVKEDANLAAQIADVDIKIADLQKRKAELEDAKIKLSEVKG